MDKSTTEFQLPSGRQYKNRRSNQGGENQPRKFQGRTSNRRLMSILLRRYEQMVRRRFGEDIDQKVDLKQLLLDCFHYDLNLSLEMKIPYTHLDELVQTEKPREERNGPQTDIQEIHDVVASDGEEQEE